MADEASCLAQGSQPPTAEPPGNSAPSTPDAQQGGTGQAEQQPPTPTPSTPEAGGTNPTATSGSGAGGTTNGRGAAPAKTSGGAGATDRCIATRVTREATEAEAATLASNKAPANTARTTLTVSVGDGASGNATDGHFDLGPAIENGTLVARIKDDRSQPAQWVDPTSLTFALGDAARITAPADLGFVASAGSSVWLIPSTQIAGVPWLGLNSQREEIVTGTTGGVQFTLDAVEGPGRVAVFNAGALGSGVGEHVFDGPGSTYTLGANTHAHQNWVFTAPGTYTLTITMRVTPNGEALAGSGFGSGGDLTATYHPATADYSLSLSGKTLFPIAAESHAYPGVISSGSSTGAPDAVRPQGTGWQFVAARSVTIQCVDTKGNPLSTIVRYVPVDERALVAPQLPGYRLQSTLSPLDAGDTPLTLTLTYKKTHNRVFLTAIDEHGALLATDTLAVAVGESLVLHLRMQPLLRACS